MDKQKTKGPKHHNIFINDEKYKVEKDVMTGAELKQLGNIPTGNKLFLEVPGPGKPDKVIGDNQEIEIKSGMRFYDLPPAQVGKFKGSKNA